MLYRVLIAILLTATAAQAQMRPPSSGAREPPAGESASSAPAATNRLAIRFSNRLGPVWQLAGLELAVDGTVVYKQGFTTRAPPRTAVLFDSTTTPGSHEVRVAAHLRGRGGPFSYLRGYRVIVRDAMTVRVTAQQPLELGILLDQRPDPTLSAERRPRVRILPVVPAGQ